MVVNATDAAGSLRTSRLAAGLSQEALARLADCSLTYVRVVESGYSPAWELSPKLRRLAGILGLSEHDLISTSNGAGERGAVAKSAGQGQRAEQ